MKKNQGQALNIQILKFQLPASVYQRLSRIMKIYEINTQLRLCHFLSQCAHQSSNFTRTTESLTYTTAKRIKDIYPKHIKTEQQALQYVKNSRKLANKVYSNRLGNGNQGSNDGYNYIGRGYIQLTGRNNYTKFANFIRDLTILENPELVATKYALESAAYFWRFIGNCNSKADEGQDEETVEKVTRSVNGGTNGLKDRIQKFNQFNDISNESSF